MTWNPFALWRNWRRSRLVADPVPGSWQRRIETTSAWRWLTQSERARLTRVARILVAEKNWEGCAGLELTNEIRITIAAEAALLVLHRPTWDYPGVTSILVYPHAFVNPLPQHSDGGVITTGLANHGEAWRRGPVVLDWDAAQAGIAIVDDGRNLVLHEFAHKLDMLDGYADGVPPIALPQDRRRWHDVMLAEFEALRDASDRGRATLLDQYGTINPAEFFAVATECFFERAPAMARRHPDLYAILRDYFGLDLAARIEAS